MNKIRVFIVDDSALMRKIISDLVNSQPDMEVVAVAKNGQELLDKLEKISVDVITLDIEMPVMDGILTLKELKRRKIEYPIIMLSSVSTKSTELTMDSLEAGAFDFVRKPGGAISLNIENVKDELLSKIKVAFYKNDNNASKIINRKNVKIDTKSIVKKECNFPGSIDAVVIGASTGGPKALYTVITSFPEYIGVPVFVVQHMPPGFTKAFADRINANCKLKVTEATDNEKIEKNTVYIAPGGFHMEVGSDKKIHLNKEPSIWGVRPAVDKLFISASKVYGSRVVSAILTGMGKDGAQGTCNIKDNGGFTISEDEETCTIYGMPKAAYETGKVDMVLPLNEITPQIVKIINCNGR